MTRVPPREHGDAAQAAIDDTVRSDDALLAEPIAPLGVPTSSQAGLKAGSVVGKGLRLLRIIGRGGMGCVWAAHHQALDTEVAVKFILAEVAQRRPLAAQRFEREARTAAKLKSPHVVKIFDHGQTELGHPYIVMELLEGEALADRLDREGPMPLREVRRVVEQVADVLGEAHAAGILHRDIKPHNVFLVKTSTELFVKLLDFGIAKASEHTDPGMLTQTGALVGTPSYMSPEQLLGTEAPSPASDLWALGVVAYEACTGELPFHGDTVAALGAAVASGKFRLASEVSPRVPPALDAWFARALALDPQTRFREATLMARQLTACCDDLPLSTFESAPTRRSIRPEPLALSDIRPSTFDGATSAPRDGRMLRRTLLVAAALGVAVVGYGLSRPDAPPAPASPSEPSAAAAAPSATSTATTVVATTVTTASPPPSAASSAQRVPPPPPRAAGSVPAGAATSLASARPSSSFLQSKPAYCSNASLAFDVASDGSLVLKPECR